MFKYRLVQKSTNYQAIYTPTFNAIPERQVGKNVSKLAKQCLHKVLRQQELSYIELMFAFLKYKMKKTCSS